MGEQRAYTIDELKMKSIQVDSNTEIVCSQINSTITLGIDNWIKSLNGQFSVRNNKTIAFIEDSRMFVTVCTESVLHALHSANFHKGQFLVSLSASDYPEEEATKKRWNKILASA